MKETEKRLEKEIDEILRQAEEVDAEEDRLYGADKRGDELPAELARRETRLQRIREAMAALEEEARMQAAEEEKERQQKASKEKKNRKGPKGPKDGAGSSRSKMPADGPEPHWQWNFTDPDSRIMWNTSTKSFEQAYNAQAAVDAEAQFIVAACVTQEANDKEMLVPMGARIKQTAGCAPRKLLADAGYCSEENLTDETLEYVDLYVACNRQKHGAPAPVAPRGRIPDRLSAVGRMQRKLRTKVGKAVYKARKHIVEPVFGQIKEARNIRQFLLRGLDNAHGEWQIICMTHNLRKMFGKGWRPALA